MKEENKLHSDKLEKMVKEMKAKQNYMSNEKQTHIPRSTSINAVKQSATQMNADVKKLIMTINPAKGNAIIELAEWIRSNQSISEYTKVLQIASELLSTESIGTCETLVTLINDGYTGNLGEILTAARKLQK